MTTANNTNISSIRSLLATQGCGTLKYDSCYQLYYSEGWMSGAGNVYSKGFRVSDRVLFVFSIGQGYCRTFINGISVYIYDGNRFLLVGSKLYSCTFFSNSFIDSECKQIIVDYIKSQARLAGSSVTEVQASQMATELVRTTYNRLLN